MPTTPEEQPQAQAAQQAQEQAPVTPVRGSTEDALRRERFLALVDEAPDVAPSAAAAPASRASDEMPPPTPLSTASLPSEPRSSGSAASAAASSAPRSSASSMPVLGSSPSTLQQLGASPSTASPASASTSNAFAAEQPKPALAFGLDMLEKVFFLTLSPKRAVGDVRFLRELAADVTPDYLRSVSLPDLADRALLTYLMSGQCRSASRYFAACYAACAHQITTYTNLKLAAYVEQFKASQDLLVSYMAMIVQGEAPFPVDGEAGVAQLRPLMDEVPRDQTLRPFLRALLEKLSESSPEALCQLVDVVYGMLAQMHIGTRFQTTLDLLRAFLASPAFCHAVVTSTHFLPIERDGATLEHKSFVGRLLHLSVFPDVDESHAMFEHATDRNGAAIPSLIAEARSLMAVAHDQLFNVVKALLAVPECRGAVNTLLRTFLLVNADRAKMFRTQQSQVSSDGALHMYASMVLRFAQPIMVVGKYNLDPRYVLHPAALIDLRDQSRLAMTGGKADQLTNQVTSGSFTFATHIFFLALQAHHIGIVPIIKQIHQVLRRLRELGEAGGLENAATAEEFANLIRVKVALDGSFFEPSVFALSMQMYEYYAGWMLKLAQVQDNGDILCVDAPVEFASQPSGFFEDMTAVVRFVAESQADVAATVKITQVIAFATLFLGNGEFITNPHIRQELMLMLLTIAQQKPLRFLFEQLAVTNRFLFPNLMQLYVDVERTGSASQFYDKFGMRFHIASLMEILWQIDSHRARLMQASFEAEDLFLHFVNMVLNDLIYLLDESLTKFTKMHDLEVEFDKPDFAALPDDQQQDMRQLYDESSRQSSACMQLANATVSLIHRLTKEIVEPLCGPALVDRLAQMLNYFLLQLAGKRCSNLQLRDPKKHHFHPDVLLRQMVELFVSLGVNDNFMRAVCLDERSFSIELFEAAATAAEKLATPVALAQFRQVIGKLKALKSQLEDDEAELGDVPDEFCDPIACTVMNDPVRLPNGITMDRAVIERHLLTDPSNPFTREHLTVDMLKPDLDMKRQIEEYRAKRRAERAAAPQ